MIDRRYTPSRTVKPRKPTTNAARPIIAVIDESACDEQGTTFATDEVITALRTLPPHIIVTANESASLLKRIQDRYGSNPNFNFRVAPVEREIFTGKENGRKLTLSLTAVAYFGWSKEKTGRTNSIRNRYHFLIDPLTFSNFWLEERTLPAYIAWMQEVRDFCVAQNWNLRPTQGSVARQALQDKRFYPEDRRKVPRSTNERVRKQLPGNHYQLGPSVEIGEEYSAEYLDQSRCHHYHAINAKLPDANHIYGYGYFRDPDCGKVYRKSPERITSFLNGFMGLIYGTVYWRYSQRDATPFIPRCLRDYGTEKNPLGSPIYFYSEDLPLFESLGVRVTGIVAAWGSKKQDTGLAKYAQWALDELEESAPLWKKTLLLSPYGGLATTARKHSVAFHRSKGGKPVTLRTKHGTKLPVSYHEASKVSEPSTNNVLHRALIEASTRTETLLYARFLEDAGYRVLCIYVDAVIVEQDSDLPILIPAPWRLDKSLTRLRFMSESQFTSVELTKLPGISGQQRRRLSLGTFRGGRGGRTLTLGDRDAQRLRAHEAWQNQRETREPPKSALDNMTSEERWEILSHARAGTSKPDWSAF